MYAVEFETMAKDGYIYIPDEYKNEIDNKKNIRLVVMYDDERHSSRINRLNKKKNKDDIQLLEQLFSASNNKVVVSKEQTTDTTGMIDEIS